MGFLEIIGIIALALAAPFALVAAIMLFAFIARVVAAVTILVMVAVIMLLSIPIAMFGGAEVKWKDFKKWRNKGEKQ